MVLSSSSSGAVPVWENFGLEANNNVFFLNIIAQAMRTSQLMLVKQHRFTNYATDALTKKPADI